MGINTDYRVAFIFYYTGLKHGTAHTLVSLGKTTK